MKAAALHHAALRVKTVTVAGHHLGEGDRGAGGPGCAGGDGGDLASNWWTADG